MPYATFDKARTDLWDLTKREIVAIMEMFDNRRVVLVQKHKLKRLF